MQLDDVDITFNTDLNKSIMSVDDSLELNINSIKINEPVDKNHNVMSFSSSTPIKEPKLDRVHTPNTTYFTPQSNSVRKLDMQSPTKHSHPAQSASTTSANEADADKNKVEKYKELILSSASKHHLQRMDEKLDNTNSDFPLQKLVKVDPKSHKIQITIDPDSLMKYLQVISKAFIILLSIVLTLTLLVTFYYEVNDELRMQYIEKQAEMQQCHVEYSENHCDTLRAPRMQDLCNTWEKCMRQDPFKYNTMVMIPKVIAKCLEHFVDVLSLKTLAVLLIVLVVVAYMKKTPTYIMNLQKEAVEETLGKLE